MAISRSFKALLLCGAMFCGALTALAQSPVVPPPSVLDVTQPTIVQVAGKVTLRDGTFVGRGYDAYWGIVQVQASIQNGRIVGIDALKSPNHNRTSKSINRKALPMLLQQVVKRQSARVNMISGATLTSRAYISSLRDALKQASN
jgi:uncharacterized protein with FMN-binding domain